jgi:hypothetical protein
MSADPTPRFVPAIDRRRPDPLPDSVRLDPEAARAAMDEAKRVESGMRDGHPGCSLESLVILAVLAYLRTAKETARRGAFFPLRNGTRLEGVHPKDVQAAMATLQRWGGELITGPEGEETLARAVAAAFASRDRRAAEGRQHHRRPDPRVAAMVDQVAHRVAVHRTVVSGAQR